MSEELDRRAARAMGWTETNLYPSWVDEAGGSHWVGGVEGWSPSTDRNDLAELLREVERRELQKEFIDEMSSRAPMLTSQQLRNFEDDWLEPFWYMTADPAIICEAACKVLE